MTRYPLHSIIALTAFLSAATAGKADPPTQPAPPEEKPKIVTLTVDPAPEPVPSFAYRLRIHYMDQKPGNAALQYHTAINLCQGANKDGDDDKISEWLDLPPEKLPANDVRELLDRYTTALKQTRLAARYEHCDWEYPIREQGVDTLLPALSPYRKLAKLTALNARLAISQNKLTEALDDIQTGYAMAKHVCQSPVLIGDLVGYAILGITNRQVQAWIQAPKAGNLYWALADIPAPFKDPRLLLGGEEGWLFFSFPALRESKLKPSPAEWTRMIEDVNKLMGGQNQNGWESKLAATAVIMKRYPNAKKALVASGHSAQEVDAMPAAQVVILAGFEAFTRQRDDMFKWFTVPYHVARPHLLEVEKKLSRPQEDMEGYPFMVLLPALNRAYYSTTRAERELAAMRCLEAIRWYAAANNGQLPASLSQITAVPLPIDPITGQEFVYRLEGTKATLIAVRPEGEPLKEETHYVITLRQP